MRQTLTTILVAMVTVALVGCTSSRSSKVYSRNAAMTAQTVKGGTVERVEEVKIEGTRSGTGGVAGAAAGGVLGSQVGQGRGSVVGAVAGALVGAAAGALTEEKITGSKGLEITVNLDDGGQIIVVQEADEQFAPGDRVRIITGSGKTRVRH